MSIRGWTGLAVALALGSIAGLAPAQVEISKQVETGKQLEATAPEVTARAFAQAVVAVDGATTRAMGTAQMATALTDAALGQLVGQLTAQIGAIAEVGFARLDDRVGGFHRFRVPVRGAVANIDFQVVIDTEGRIAGLFMLPHVPEPVAAAPDAGPAPHEVDVSVGPADSPLPGTLTLPEGDGPFPAVVLVHGSGANDRDELILGNRPFRDIAHGLAARGVATLRYDKRSLVAPQSLLAHGAKLTVQHEVIDDAVAAVAVLRGRAEIDPARVVVLGHSLGGMVAPRIVKEAKADGMIVMAGCARALPEVMIEQVQYLNALDDTVTTEEAAQLDLLKVTVAELRASQRDTAQASTWRLGAPPGYYTDLEAHDGPAEAAALDIPILILQGVRDYQVTLKDFTRWRLALASQPFACVKLYGDLDHLMRPGEGKSGPDDYAASRPVAPVVIEDIAGFVLAGCATPGR